MPELVVIKVLGLACSTRMYSETVRADSLCRKYNVELSMVGQS